MQNCVPFSIPLIDIHCIHKSFQELFKSFHAVFSCGIVQWIVSFYILNLRIEVLQQLDNLQRQKNVYFEFSLVGNYVMYVFRVVNTTILVFSYLHHENEISLWLGHAVDLLRSHPEKITSYMWGGTPLQGSRHCHPEKNLIVHVGDPITRFPSLPSWQNHIIHGGDPITRFPSWTVTRFLLSNHIIHVGGPCYKVLTFIIRYGGTTRVIDSYKVPTFHIRYGGTRRVIDSYKVPAVDS